MLDLEGKRRICIQRDYSTGMDIKFRTNFPNDISHLMDESTWNEFITRLNYLFAKAETANWHTILETFVGCFTCYLNRLFTKSYGYKQIDKIVEFIDETNKQVMIPRGLYMSNPVEKGFRYLDITLINEKYEPKMEVYQNVPVTSVMFPR